jgi:hypothetical protein
VRTWPTQEAPHPPLNYGDLEVEGFDGDTQEKRIGCDTYARVASQRGGEFVFSHKHHVPLPSSF